MEQEEETSTMSPFWLPKTTTNHHRLRRTYSLIQTTTSFFILLIITALVLTFIVVPTLKSFTSNIFKPQTIKHSWDYLNLILVLFAVVCGFLTKNDTNETQRFDSYNYNNNHRRSFSNPETPPSWYDDSNRSFNRLRTVGSVPDLRQRTVYVEDDDRYRFYDDTSVHFRYRNLRFEDELHRETVTSGEVFRQSLPDSRIEDVRRNVERIYEVETVEKSEINDDSVAENSYLPSPPSPPPQPAVRKKKSRSVSKENAATVNSVEFSSPVPELNPHPLPAVMPVARKGKSRSASKEDVETVASAEFSSPVLESEGNLQPPVMRTKGVRRNVKRTYQSETIENSEDSDFVAENSQLPPPVTVVASPLWAERKIGIPVKKKRVNATKEFLASLRGKKKKKQRQKSVENFESSQNSQPTPVVSQPPPPPPPPPPPSVFQSLFSSNKSKHKKHYHVPVATYKPQLPNKREQSNYRLKENVIIGNESPLIPIPPPPPPPPFKLPAWKFRVQGDYVRVDSIGSSRSDSPDSDEVLESPISQCSNSPYADDGEERRVTEIGNASEASLFCPSPDVDTKAQNFIQNFRAGLRIAKMNSLREKQGIGMSNLGKPLS
ncbi:hypothetical protein TSUD_350820 [Trifolium subterraneum]|uniref:Uncharacterized protein n=1 Tax=Trifolium subterraneum TaxID=3900 RepID=A0A2Z6NBL1_TRISU|nr:hypothetical protein TSUD_350820 [Trifolium subterraneum]